MNANSNFVPGQLEAERSAAMPACRATVYQALVGGAVKMERRSGGRCPACGGLHLVADLFDAEGQIKAALSQGPSGTLATVQKIQGEPLTADDLAHFDRIDAANGKPGHTRKMLDGGHVRKVIGDEYGHAKG